MISAIATRLTGLRRGLISDRRGVAAVEFALIVPLMLSMYFVTLEVAQGIETRKKVARVGSMVADLVTQQATITVNELNAIMKIGGATMQPYRRSPSTVTITAIQVSSDTTPKAKVVWSRRLAGDKPGAGEAVGSTVTLPGKLNTAGAFLIRVDSKLTYKPVVIWTSSQQSVLGIKSPFKEPTMSDTYFLRPRMSTSIPCTDC